MKKDILAPWKAFFAQFSGPPEKLSVPLDVLQAAEKVASVFEFYENILARDGHNKAFYMTRDYPQAREMQFGHPSVTLTLYCCDGDRYANFKRSEAVGNSEAVNNFKIQTDQMRVSVYAKDEKIIYRVSTKVGDQKSGPAMKGFYEVETFAKNFAETVNPDYAFNIARREQMWGRNAVSTPERRALEK